MSKKLWGNITWKLFHTMTIRLKDDGEQIQQALDCITVICKNLPCPLCSQEAISLLKKYNIKNIKTREEFKKFIWDFHNKVNSKLKQPIVEYNQVDSLHSDSLNHILNEFFKIYKQIKHNTNMMLYQFHREIIVTKTRKYFLEHRDNYDFV